ncbi:eukaryotic aspartyl protease [Hirsutella rhossiliensis]|uniref:Eukaryotic aspartyl protease domain-containing protein n=1 Tax=Hirsutella rhossiliensis TaxID=111463 RepID=A0A9P8N3L5_9HYPO|nr:eukaryotic aspartyl protease domain-containing protein [Hirsutella rhossiliensis]KAH0967718.1 eukaryotic aspartyl protease domain-containing protein [Hirsutella rhossiliensis]
MHFNFFLTFLMAGFLTVVTSSAIQKRSIQKRSFTVERVANPGFTGRNGPRALAKAYRKYRMPLPRDLVDALEFQEFQKRSLAAEQQQVHESSRGESAEEKRDFMSSIGGRVSLAGTIKDGKEASSKEASRKEASSKVVSSKDACSKEASREEASSKDASSKVASSKEASREEASREDASSKVASNKVASNKVASSKDASSKDASSKAASSKAASREDASSKAASREDASSKVVSNKVASREDASSKAASREDASSKVVSNKVASREDASSKAASREDASSKVVSNKVASREDASSKAASREDASSKVASNKVASNKVASNKVASNKVASNKVASREDASSKAASSKAASREDASSKVASSKVASNKVASREDASSKAASSKDASNKEASSKAASSKDASNKEASRGRTKPAAATIRLDPRPPIGGQMINLDFDTGSSDLWVFNTQLPQQSTVNHRLYDPAKSRTFSAMQGSQFLIQYGDGSGAKGNPVQLATAVTGQFVQDQNNDGLMGLAFSKLNTVKPQKQMTFFDTIKSSLAMPVFTADLRKNATGVYTFGSIDQSKFQGQLTSIPVNTSMGFWQFSSEKFAVNGGQQQAATPGGQAIADTGTTLILADAKIVNGYYQQVQGAQNNSQMGGFTVPCNAKLPDLDLDVGGNYMARVTGDNINFAPVGNGQCFGGVQAAPAGTMGIYGDIFFKSQFVVFNGGNNTLSMAPHS